MREKNTHYDLQLASCWRCDFRTAPRNKVHRHNFYEPCLVVGGSGFFEQGGQTYALKKGDLFVADDGVYHEILSLETRDLELVFLAFSVRSAEKPQPDPSVAIIEAFLLSHAAHVRGRGHLRLAFDVVFDLQRRQSPSPYAQELRNEYMRLLVLQIMDALSRPLKGFKERKPTRSERLRRVLDHVDSSLHEPVRVEELAQLSGMSERTFRRMIHDETGETVTHLIQRRRLRRAAQLLLLPELTVAEVGYRLGIEDPAQFSRWFKEMTGSTPRRFRLATHREAANPDGVSMATEFR